MASTMLHEKCCNTVLQIGAPLLVTPAGTSNELDVRNKWEENTHNTYTCQKKNVCLKKNQNAPRSSEHPPVRVGGNVKTFRWDQRLQIPNLFMAFKRVPR